MNEEYNLLKKQYSLLKNIDLNEKNLFDIVSAQCIPTISVIIHQYPELYLIIFQFV